MHSFTPTFADPRDRMFVPSTRAAALALFVVACGFSVCPAYGQTKQPNVEDVSLTTEDKVDLRITYYKSGGGKESAVLVLLHGKQENRQKWKSVASILQEKGDFAVVTVDLRGHGDSILTKSKKINSADDQSFDSEESAPSKGKKVNYRDMMHDMDAVKQFIFDEHQNKNLNMNKIGIIACDVSASVAIVYTALDWEKEPYEDDPVPDQRTPRGKDIRALVLISPDTSTPGLSAAKTAQAFRELTDLSVMIAVSETNGHDFTVAKELFKQMSVKRVSSDQMVLMKYPEKLRGMDLVLKDQKLKNDMAEFLAKFLQDKKEKDIPAWRDRRSRTDR